jgi:hypothetical protein
MYGLLLVGSSRNREFLPSGNNQHKWQTFYKQSECFERKDTDWLGYALHLVFVDHGIRFRNIFSHEDNRFSLLSPYRIRLDVSKAIYFYYCLLSLLDAIPSKGPSRFKDVVSALTRIQSPSEQGRCARLNRHLM